MGNLFRGGEEEREVGWCCNLLAEEQAADFLLDGVACTVSLLAVVAVQRGAVPFGAAGDWGAAEGLGQWAPRAAHGAAHSASNKAWTRSHSWS